MDNGFYLVKFNSMEDYNYAKYGGPWIVFNHYLTVKPWKPKFDPSHDSLQNLLVWVRIPCLPIEYFDHHFLMRLG